MFICTLSFLADPSVNNMPFSGSTKLDPFGWWSDQENGSHLGTPTNYTYGSRWLWQSSDTVDDGDHSFEKFTGTWDERNATAGSTLWRDHAWSSATAGAWAVWGLKAPITGTFGIEIFLPNLPDVTYPTNAEYTLFVPSDTANKASGGTAADKTTCKVDQQAKRSRSGFVSLRDARLTSVWIKAKLCWSKLQVPSGATGTSTVFDAARLAGMGPLALSSSGASPTSIRLNWTGNATNQDGYQIFRNNPKSATQISSYR